MITNCSVKFNQFPDTVSIIIQVDCDSDAYSCQLLTAKSTFTLHRKKKKSDPKSASSITSHIFICLPLLSTKKVGKHLHTYMTLVTKGKIRWSLNASFKLLTLLHIQQKLKRKISIYLLSAVLHHKSLIKVKVCTDFGELDYL